MTANTPYEYSDVEINFKLAEIEGNLNRSEYSKVLNSAVVLIITMRKINKNPQTYEEKVISMVKRELEVLKAQKSEKFVYQQRVIEFVKMSQSLMWVTNVREEKFIEDILSLTESSRMASRTKRFVVFPINQQKGIVNRDTNYMKNILMFSSVLLSSSNDEVVQREKSKFRNKIHGFVTSLCGDENLNSHLISKRFRYF